MFVLVVVCVCLSSEIFSHEITDIKQYTKCVTKIKMDMVKSEWESSGEYNDRISKFHINDTTLFIELPNRVGIFDADTRKYTFTIYTSRIYDKDFNRYNVLPVYDTTLSQSTYSGQNAYGAKIDISKKLTYDINFKYSSDDNITIHSDSMDIDYAKSIKHNISHILEISVKHNDVIKCKTIYNFLQATFDRPNEYGMQSDILYGEIVNIYTINNITKEIIVTTNMVEEQKKNDIPQINFDLKTWNGKKF